MRLLAEHRWTLFNRSRYMEELTIPRLQPLLSGVGEGCSAVYTNDVHSAMNFHTDSYSVWRWWNRTSTGCNLRGLMLR